MKARPLLFLIAASVAVAALALSGCGDEEETSGETEPAARQGATGPAGGAQGRDEPGAPAAGEPAYSGLGSWWLKLDSGDRLSSAAEFIEANPESCDAVGADDLERQTRIAYGIDFALNATVSEVMLETCALIRDGG